MVPDIMERWKASA